MDTQNTKRKWSRRELIKTGAAGLAAAALPRPARAAAPAGKLSVWGLITFAPEADKLINEQLQEFGKLKNIAVEYVVVPFDQMDRKLAAVIEAKSPPDLVMLAGNTFQYYRNKGWLVEVTDILNDIRKQGGGIYESVLPQVMDRDKAYGIPFEPEIAPMHVRSDVMKQHGITLPIATWNDFTEACRKINNPPNFYAWGMTLGHTNDAYNNILHVIWAHGGKLVERDGKTVALKSEGTLAAIKLIAQWYLKDKIIPPDSLTGDDAWNNKVYQSGMVAVIDNQASVYGWLEKNDKELWRNTILMRQPRGPAGTFNWLTGYAWAIFNTSENVALAKEAIRYWMEPARFNQVVETVGGRFYPIYKDLAKGKFWTDRPAYKIYPEMLAQARFDSYAGPPTPASAEVFEHLIYPDMMQKVIVGGETPEKALDWAHNQVREIYAKHFKA